MGKLAGALNLAEKWFPAEASAFASLFSDHVDPGIEALLKGYEAIILFTLSDRLEQSIRSVTANLRCRLPPKPPVHQRSHVSQFILENIVKCGLITAAETRREDLQLPICQSCKRHLNKILLHPGAGSIRKRWPLANFLQVAAELDRAGYETEFILGPAEDGLVEKLQHSGRIVHVLNDLLELLDLFNSAGGYIGNDSGASHLSAYTGLPTTVIFGPADPERWKPVGNAVEVVRPALDCLPCFETEENNCEQQQCLENIRPQMVMEAFNRLYNRF
jgi:ADP-heptose:LPS heptosyltransferase